MWEGEGERMPRHRGPSMRRGSAGPQGPEPPHPNRMHMSESGHCLVTSAGAGAGGLFGARASPGDPPPPPPPDIRKILLRQKHEVY